MMKLSLEIKDNMLVFNYEIGQNKATSSRNLCADSLVLFSRLLEMCSNSVHHEYKQERDEWLGRMYLEKHPELKEDFK